MGAVSCGKVDRDVNDIKSFFIQICSLGTCTWHYFGLLTYWLLEHWWLLHVTASYINFSKTTLATFFHSAPPSEWYARLRGVSVLAIKPPVFHFLLYIYTPKRLPSDIGFCLPKPQRQAASGPGGHRAKIKWHHSERCRTECADWPGRAPSYSYVTYCSTVPDSARKTVIFRYTYLSLLLGFCKYIELLDWSFGAELCR